ncbi:hypothetical protein Vqi01_04160 [Micromonospora qiuiae]|uniref:Immunity protein 22 n=1 Tax=Micromonospora qiuiae TaxID=502268 RepID=A0ABQ4J525_9ACTN|nr:hypothetical protein [Micromonospora qiuiae]GIJ25254.1 hypothetical protein Vqi01_04160 [Micromonospora qiuiae]
MSDGMRDGGVLDGFHIGYVPAEAGEEVSDFASEWEDVHFASRVWERQTDDGYRADLRVHVLRGERLTDLEALRAFLVDYHERDAETWTLRDFFHGAVTGLRDESHAFWLAAPGVGVSVLIDPECLDGEALMSVSLAVLPARDG